MALVRRLTAESASLHSTDTRDPDWSLGRQCGKVVLVQNTVDRSWSCDWPVKQTSAMRLTSAQFQILPFRERRNERNKYHTAAGKA